MAYAMSPGVQIVEKDFSAIVPSVATSTGAFAGKFQWGPINAPTLVSNEVELVSQFGKPVDSTAESFFTVANFLAYSNAIYVARQDSASAVNAVSDGGVAVKIKNIDDYNSHDFSASTYDWVAKYAGTMGNSLKVSSADSATFSAWAYKAYFDSAPSTSEYATKNNGSGDELHVIVIDEDGQFTGTAGTVLEKFAFVSKASDAKKYDGSNNYYKDVINSQSKYIWWANHPTELTGSAAWGNICAGSTFKTLTANPTYSMDSGVDDYVDAGSYVQTTWALYNSDLYQIDLLPLGKATAVTANAVIAIAESRKDVVVFVSPQDVSTGNVITGSGSSATTALTTYRDAITPSSSYGVIDTGYKYQYDRYNDKYRWIPLNGDIAGLTARTEYTNDAWWSPAGYTRGQIKNVVKLAVNPTKTDRDVLYQDSINPVVAFPGDGVVLYGDKTLLKKPSAFDRINVRRLFIILEKSISKASKYQLFEFNDDFTRAQFRNMVEPFLRDVKGRRGITDFRVVCDTTNNTAEVIDRNEFVADIYIKPARSINFITLSFIATRSGIDFSTVGA